MPRSCSRVQRVNNTRRETPVPETRASAPEASVVQVAARVGDVRSAHSVRSVRCDALHSAVPSARACRGGPIPTHGIVPQRGPLHDRMLNRNNAMHYGGPSYSKNAICDDLT